MATALSDMSFWIKFFKEAGIPAGDAANYAVTFSDNRITRAMLMDLTKDYLNDMGIGILGDVISILKHAKSVFSQDVRDRALRDAGSCNTTPTRDVPSPKRSTPASRTIGHYIGTDRSASPTVIPTPPAPNISKSLSARLGTQHSPSAPAAKISSSLSARLGTMIVAKQTPPTVVKLPSNTQKEVVPVPKNRRVFPEHEGKYKITMPAGSTVKTRQILEMQRKKAEAQRIKAEEKKRLGQGKDSVFTRLGSEKPKATSPSGPTITITGLGNINMANATQASVFNRLGGKTTVKRAATSTVTFDDDDDDIEDDIDLTTSTGEPLEYAGVLKPGGSSAKKAKLEAAKKIKKVAKQTLAAKAPVLEPESEGLFSRKSGLHNIKSRLGPKGAEVSSTTQTTPVKSSKISKEGIQSRLGGGQLDKITITVDTTTASPGGNGVFSRLGKPK